MRLFQNESSLHFPLVLPSWNTGTRGHLRLNWWNEPLYQDTFFALITVKCMTQNVEETYSVLSGCKMCRSHVQRVMRDTENCWPITIFKVLCMMNKVSNPARPTRKKKQLPGLSNIIKTGNDKRQAWQSTSPSLTFNFAQYKLFPKTFCSKGSGIRNYYFKLYNYEENEAGNAWFHAQILPEFWCFLKS